jgi:hypothetical protein
MHWSKQIGAEKSVFLGRFGEKHRKFPLRRSRTCFWHFGIVKELDIEEFPIQSGAEAGVGEIFLFFLKKTINFINTSSDIYVRES